MMKNNALVKSLIFFFVLLSVITSSFAFVVWTHEDPDNRVKFNLIDQSENRFSEKDLAGRYSMVYFGFTNCTDVCPFHMATLSGVMKNLDDSGHGDLINPVFITVDPEHDNPDVISRFLNHFDNRFVGLSGPRSSLEAAAHSFNTYLQEAPKQISAETNKSPDHSNHGNHEGHDMSGGSSPIIRQITHTTMLYLLDPYGRIIDYVSADLSNEAIAEKIRGVL